MNSFTIICNKCNTSIQIQEREDLVKLGLEVYDIQLQQDYEFDVMSIVCHKCQNKIT